uniref:Very-long-chain (3R)-3-hydroxyacyl-CoA dehydratase n=1 Tax=Oryza glumipatula TaxID=40148 RepID=A0A0D9ZIA0_9ORYZ
MAGVGSAVRRLYLSVYNWAVFFGWYSAASRHRLLAFGSLFSWLDLGVLYYAVTTLLESGHEAVYAAVERPLQFAQTAAFLEILAQACIIWAALT